MDDPKILAIGKGLVLLLWTWVVLGLAVPSLVPASAYAGIVGGVTALAHVIEFFVQQKVLKNTPQSMGYHFVQTLIFGFTHWLPIVHAAKRSDARTE